MTETIDQQIQELEEAGWEADNAPRAVARSYAFASYTDTINFLMEVGKAAEGIGVMPAIHIDGGTEVNVRVGRPPAPSLSEAELALATALAAA